MPGVHETIMSDEGGCSANAGSEWNTVSQRATEIRRRDRAGLESDGMLKIMKSMLTKRHAPSADPLHRPKLVTRPKDNTSVGRAVASSEFVSRGW